MPFPGQINLFLKRIAAIFISFDKLPNEERGCSVVECLTRDRGVAGSSLIGGTALCP